MSSQALTDSTDRLADELRGSSWHPFPRSRDTQMLDNPPISPDVDAFIGGDDPHGIAAAPIPDLTRTSEDRYSEEVMYGRRVAVSRQFQASIVSLRGRAERICQLAPDDVEYGYQVALLWADIGRLKEFLGPSPAVTELVAELRTARFQFLGKDTPVAAVQTLLRALGLISNAGRIDTSLVDRVVDILEAGGFDSLAQDELRETDG